MTRESRHAASLYAGTLVEGSLAGVELTDCTAAFGSFGAAVVRAAPPSPVCAAAGGAEAGGEGEGEVEVAPQWTFRLLHCPAKLQPVDQRLEVTVATPLELVHNARLLDRVRRFLDVLGESERAELAQLVRQQAESLREVTLESVLARRKSTDVQLRLAAPRLILPQDLSSPDTGVLVLDMGAISLASMVAQGGETAAAAAADASAEGSGDGPEWLYDRFALSISSIQATLSPNRLDLGRTSAAPRPHLGRTSAASRLPLGCLSAASRLHLGCTSAAPRLASARLSQVPLSPSCSRSCERRLFTPARCEQVILSPSKASLRAAPERAHYLVLGCGGLLRCRRRPNTRVAVHRSTSSASTSACSAASCRPRRTPSTTSSSPALPLRGEAGQEKRAAAYQTASCE